MNNSVRRRGQGTLGDHLAANLPSRIADILSRPPPSDDAWRRLLHEALAGQAEQLRGTKFYPDPPASPSIAKPEED